MKHAKTLETHEQRFTELEARLTALEARTAPKHVNMVTKSFRAVKTAADSEAPALAELTTEEQAYLTSKNIAHDSRQHHTISVNGQHMTAEEKAILHSIKRKRSITVNTYN